ncbi:hypothetical protein VTN31DRAFT_960 [Thermomyces dupontii]|uniref:uncharacterized protein n=1 Tax=Talaromyces thermophilus TaxID=28565 RepID=UPI0037426807
MLWMSMLYVLLDHSHALHHMKTRAAQKPSFSTQERPFRISNHCPVDIYPAIITQHGRGPSTGGYRAQPGNTTNFTVSADWQGRIWGRTNCSFNGQGTGPKAEGGWYGTGQACLTGDCGGVIDCKGTGHPATLAEFTMSSDMNLSFYDISLVDGYNLPMAIVSLHTESDDSSLASIPPNMTNPVCIGSPNFLLPLDSISDTVATVPVNVTVDSMTYKTPLEESLERHAVSRWCPWSLQLQPPPKPGDGVFPYPDDNIPRPDFDPCLSSCSKYGRDEDCCAGNHNSPSTCGPNLYSKAAKRVCPDAYSYAYDDTTSTFSIREGAGFEVIFCPKGRSTNIQKSMHSQGQSL